MIPNAILSNLNAVELSNICPNPNQECQIRDPQYKTIENHNPLITNKITISAQLADFINYSDITSQDNQAINISNGKIWHLMNYGKISGGIFNSGVDNALATITNYGEMRGFWAYQQQSITIDNRGTMKTAVGSYLDNQTKYAAHFVFENSSSKLFIKNFKIKIIESQDEFNNFKGYVDMRDSNKNSHLLIYYGNVAFIDNDSKIILDFGDGFELRKGYKTAMLVTKQDGAPFDTLGLDFSRLTTRSSLYKLTQSGDNFIANIDAPNSEIGILHKSNVRTMNNFYLMSNSMIYPHKYKVATKRTQNKRRVIRRAKKVSSLRELQSDSNALLSSLRDSTQSVESWQSTDSIKSFNSLESLESHESFSYKSDSNNLSDSLNTYSDSLSDSNNLSDSSDFTTSTNQNNTNPIRIANTNQKNQRETRPRISTNREVKSTIPSIQSNQSNNNYYFILTPFINHNLFLEQGRYNLSGFDYGFLTAFSGKLNSNNTLGAHFMMSYGSLGDSKDKDFMIKTLNLNLGLNYKLDLIWDMFIKARGDFYYFLNQAKTLTLFEAIKPNNLGFGASVSYGKDFDFKKGGILGIEVGLDYKALQSSKVELQNSVDRSVSETYQKSLYSLIYADVGINYAKYFNSSIGLWGINANFGIKGNITANKLAKSQIRISNLNRNVDMVLDNDNFLGYANAGISYMLNARDFDMEFSLAYYGNYGDRIISNAGGFEWRVLW